MSEPKVDLGPWGLVTNQPGFEGYDMQMRIVHVPDKSAVDVVLEAMKPDEPLLQVREQHPYDALLERDGTNAFWAVRVRLMDKMKELIAAAVAVLLMLNLSGCIAVGAISGGIIGTLAPIGIAAASSDPDAKAAPQTIIISGLVCAGIGALIGILAVEDNKKATPNEPEPERRGRAAEGRDSPAAEEQDSEDPEA